MPNITQSQFIKRFCTLILGKSDLPKKQDDLHILLFSSIMQLDPERQYTEKEINQHLQDWTVRFGGSFGLDHVTLRRFLIDEGYIQRDVAGASYQVAKGELKYIFDPSIKELDLDEQVKQARRERDERKQQYLKGNPKS